MRQARGTKRVQSRFKAEREKEKIRATYNSEFKSLEEKINEAANRLGWDLSDASVASKIVDAAYVELDDDERNALGRRGHAERFLGIAYIQI